MITRVILHLMELQWSEETPSPPPCPPKWAALLKQKHLIRYAVFLVVFLTRSSFLNGILEACSNHCRISRALTARYCRWHFQIVLFLCFYDFKELSEVLEITHEVTCAMQCSAMQHVIFKAPTPLSKPVPQVNAWTDYKIIRPLRKVSSRSRGKQKQQ